MSLETLLKKPMILVANDDGIFSPGIKALAFAMREVGDVFVVAPDVEQSAVGHSITVRRPLRFKHTKAAGFGDIPAYRVDGTPADCVVLGAFNLGTPDLVVSGINIGSNLGYDLTHSGTVAAALEGTSLGIPSIAFSVRTGEDDLDFAHAAAYAPRLARAVLERGLPPKTLLNVNFPIGKPKGVRVAPQGGHYWKDAVHKRVDPDGREYFWVSGTPTGDTELDSDFAVVTAGFIAITPIKMDLTAREMLEIVQGYAPDLG
jgi:5'-nucleotidase